MDEDAEAGSRAARGAATTTAANKAKDVKLLNILSCLCDLLKQRKYWFFEKKNKGTGARRAENVNVSQRLGGSV